MRGREGGGAAQEEEHVDCLVFGRLEANVVLFRRPAEERGEEAQVPGNGAVDAVGRVELGEEAFAADGAQAVFGVVECKG